jgi:uncharacterized glyoxalase superfamily protein PhnB
MLREHGPRVALAFSRGKDALATWLQLRRFRFEVFPYYRVGLPGLRFEEESLAYYEKVFGTKIHRFLTPHFLRNINRAAFQTPANCWHADTLVEWTSDEQAAALLAARGWDPNTWEAVGIRASDNLVRSTTIKRYGPLNSKRRTWYPVYDWSNDRVFEEIKASGIKLPPDYHLWGRSLDGIHHRFMEALRREYPADYARHLEFFPLLEVEFKRLEFRDRYWRKRGQ